jgi:hypothetical protein
MDTSTTVMDTSASVTDTWMEGVEETQTEEGQTGGSAGKGKELEVGDN